MQTILYNIYIYLFLVQESTIHHHDGITTDQNDIPKLTNGIKWDYSNKNFHPDKIKKFQKTQKCISTQYKIKNHALIL